jgi:hypothetical protein
MNNISFSIPQHLADSLTRFGADISQTAKEALLVDLYRRRIITLRTVREVLEIGRIEADEVLLRHGVSHEISLEEFGAQADALRTRLQ